MKTVISYIFCVSILCIISIWGFLHGNELKTNELRTEENRNRSVIYYIEPRESISPYDKYFKSAADEIGWDWRLIVAIAWHESRFDTTVISSRGAGGIMQMMPRTALRFGLETEEDIRNPEKSIRAGAKYLAWLQRLFKDIEDEYERNKFILAAYNAGQGHVLDAIALTEKYGGNTQKWRDVEVYFLKKNDPMYFNDPVCKSGRYRANHAVGYVRKVYKTYREYYKI